MNLIKEFKDFAFKGNLIDMAVGIIIGGAFGTVMKSLVDDIFMPVLGLITGGVDFSDKYVALSKPEGFTPGMPIEAAEKTGAALLTYGNFISSLIAFLLVAAAIFIVIIKLLGSLNKKEEEAPAKDPEPTNEEKMLELLGQIRDKIS
ncbi:MAG: large-conductance mechanosensitive channel protein MscL [Verrucomicrobiales bacterium]|nr:large-conductance mechanosensitive channel protein MscL [Verrucomicrobiales bacterium]